jgi:2-dehydropantoate 2-reductase
MSDLSAKSRYALVGPGAVGLYYGGLLAESGAALNVLARSDATTLADSGITLRSVNPQNNELIQQRQIMPAQISTDARAIGRVDCVLVAAKSTYNEQLVDSLRPLIEPGRSVIVTLQNGMGNAEFLASNFPHNPILCGLCFVCVNRTAPAVIENYHPGRVEFGSLGDTWPQLVSTLVQIFKHAGVKSVSSHSLDASLWRKLCWNIAFNGLAITAGGLTTDRLLADARLARRARRLMEEIARAAALSGHVISDTFIQAQFDVTAKMGAYQPSSLIDYLAGRPVEVAAIWGEPLRRGLALGAAMPELAQLLVELKLLCR